MRDVVIIGGGLSGLAAAYELEKQQIDYTLIEVKRHLGGSIRSVSRDGFIMDAGPFAIADDLPGDWMAELDLAQATIPLQNKAVIFKEGTQKLVDAIVRRLNGPRMMRMAVSSLGQLGQRYTICLENGLMLDAKSLIIASPARYAERMLYNLAPEVADMLRTYHYDSIHRLSLGYPTAELPDLEAPGDAAYAFIYETHDDARTPEGYSLLHFGLRFSQACQPEALIGLLRQTFNMAEPAAFYDGFWQEADALSSYDDTHDQRVRDMRAQLPDGIALIGSDYCMEPPRYEGVHRLSERIQQGRDAARSMIDYIKA